MSQTIDKPIRTSSLIMIVPDEVEDGQRAPAADWDEGIAAARSGDHERALVHFRREASLRSVQGSHGRAAIAFRAAAVEAQKDPTTVALREQLMRAAGDSYAAAGHDQQLPQPTREEALRTAAMCYLHIGELDAASRCIDEGRRTASRLSLTL